jgi:AcrR family transcriptional regulator
MAQDDSETDLGADPLQATRSLLIEHGYDGLSMAAVAEMFGGSQSLIHYHFDTREGLLAALRVILGEPKEIPLIADAVDAQVLSEGHQ